MGTSFGRSTATDSILEFLKRQNPPAPSFTINATPADAWAKAMGFQNGTNDPSGGIKGREQVFLCTRITAITGQAPPAGATLMDLWDLYLNAKGYTGSLDDKFATWIQSGTF